MALTDTQVKNAKPKDRPYSLSDEKGLSLLVQPNGGKWWRFRYRFDGKAKMLSLGTYPDSGLRDVRDRRDEARKLLEGGIDPGAQRKDDKAESLLRATNSFEAVTREWCAKKSVKWVPAYADRLLRRFERDIFPSFGKKPVAEIKPPELLATIRKIEARGAIETAHRALQDCGQVFRYAIATGRAERDIAADLRGALEPVQVTHYAAVTEPAKVAELLRTLDGYQGSFIVKSALRLAPLLFVRPGELRTAQWADIDLDLGEWRYFVTKTKTEHLVPLCRQAVELLRDLYALTGQGRYVFPGHRSTRVPMSNNATLAAMRSMGITGDVMTGHGFRAMARTILDEELGIRPDFIEHQLAHAVRDANGRAYNRTSHLPARKAMMQTWADYLDKLKAGADVIPLRGNAA
jgi:integrase